MRDVAALAGVSLKTVSRVVNREPGVSATLAQRVQAAAQALDFRPNLGARSLRRADGKTATIGLVLQDLANPYSAALHRAIEDVARARNVAVLSGSVDETETRERELVTAFSSRRVDGLVIMPTGGDQSYLQMERRAAVAMVFVDRPPRQFEGDVVLAANRAGAEVGVAHLITHGHSAIAFLGDRSSIATAEQRHAGYLHAMNAAGLAIRSDLVVKDLATTELAFDAAARLLAGDRPPTAFFTAQNLVTIGTLRALRDTARQHQVALVGFDDFELSDLLEPAVTVVAQDPHEIGRLAAEILFARVDGDDSPWRREVVPTRLIVRGSGEIPPPPR
jgi:LacI family transcriptional regulator